MQDSQRNSQRSSRSSHADDRCPQCGAAAELMTFDAPQGAVSAWVYPCACGDPAPAERLEADRVRVMELAGIDPDASERCNAAPMLARVWEEGRGCYLHGPTGAGKTTMLDSMARRVVEGHMYEAGGRANCRKRVRIVGAVEMFEQLRGLSDARARARFGDLKTCDWLLLDDLGQERCTEWVVERMYELLDARYRCGGITCASSNLALPELGMRWAAADDLKARVMVRRLGFLTFDAPMDRPQPTQDRFSGLFGVDTEEVLGEHVNGR